MKTRGILALAAATGTVLVLTAGPASAAVTFDPTCPYTPSNATGACGFVGKGDVQTALHYNNTQMQKNAPSLVFAYTQPATQALSQDATQPGTQDGTQAESEALSCDGTDGHHSFTRNGLRSGSRDGTRDGSRSGSRTGSVDGSVSYTIDFDARVKNQIDGFFLTGAHSSGFQASGDPLWGGYSFGDYTWGAYTWDDTTTTWGDWVAAPGEDPSICSSNNPGIDPSSISDVVTPGAVTDGDISDGAITPGAITNGAVTATGPAQLSVNGKALN